MGNTQWDYTVIEDWKKLIGDDHLVVLPREDYKLIPVVTSIICKVYKQDATETSEESEEVVKEKKETKITL
jgi:hypothetical protein